MQRIASALVHGHSQTDYLGLARADVRGILTISLLRSGEIRDLCTGVALTTELVLTAAHCVDESVTQLEVGGQVWKRWGDEELVIEVAPERDVAVVRLPGLAARSVMAFSTEDATRWSGALVELAGAGRREEGAAGNVTHAVAEVLAVDERYLTVQLPQAGGPCAGDSGGPLLARGPTGQVEVIGVLSGGNPSCEGPDHYERVDSLSSWLTRLKGDVAGASPPCDGLTKQGRCFGARAVWCERDELRARDCSPAEACGYDVGAAGFRCVASDPCDGVPDNGRCVDGAALRCVDGRLERLDCAACSGACLISTRTGSAVCALPTAGQP